MGGIYNKFPIKELIIHARTLSQQYAGTPHIEAFKMAQDILSCPLCYNGNITDTNTYGNLIKSCPDTTAIMLGRGAIANPELPAILRNTDFNSGQFYSPDISNNVINISNFSDNKDESFDHNRFLSFHDELLAGYEEYMSGEQPVLYKMKELWTFWSRQFDVDKKTLKKIRKAQTINAYQSIVRSL